jgi:hypothetical protein
MLEQKFQIIIDDVDFLLKNDLVFKKAFPSDYKINLSWGDASMSALIRIVIGQQISSKVAQS